jgi:hypothetical protein
MLRYEPYGDFKAGIPETSNPKGWSMKQYDDTLFPVFKKI